MKTLVNGVPTLIWEKRAKIIAYAVVITIALLLFRGAVSIKDNTAATASNTEATKINTESTKQLVENLQIAVADLKEDNAQQTRFIECLLTLNGRGGMAREEIRTQCERTVTKPGGSSAIDETEGGASGPVQQPKQQPQSPTPATPNTPTPTAPTESSVLPFVEEPLLVCMQPILFIPKTCL